MDIPTDNSQKPPTEQWFVFRENARVAGPMTTSEAADYANGLRQSLLESKSKDNVSIRQSLVG